jgi:hypothetical protein
VVHISGPLGMLPYDLYEAALSDSPRF